MSVNVKDEAAKRWPDLVRRADDLLPPHMIESLLLHVLRGAPCGSFLTVVLCNAPFAEVACQADEQNQVALREWAIVLHNYVPSAAWGSKENVARWREHGGWLGREQRIEKGDATCHT